MDETLASGSFCWHNSERWKSMEQPDLDWQTQT